MKIETNYAGVVEYDEKDIITFPEGILGFEEHKDYIVVGSITADFPFLWLQAVEEKELAFILTNPFLFTENYDFNLPTSFTKVIETDNIEDIEVYTMIVISKSAKDVTTNLKSPLIFNNTKRLAAQIVLDEDYEYKHKIFIKE